jgi:hypothetical protein
MSEGFVKLPVIYELRNLEVLTAGTEVHFLYLDVSSCKSHKLNRIFHRFINYVIYDASDFKLCKENYLWSYFIKNILYLKVFQMKAGDLNEIYIFLPKHLLLGFISFNLLPLFRKKK